MSVSFCTILNSLFSIYKLFNVWSDSSSLSAEFSVQGCPRLTTIVPMTCNSRLSLNSPLVHMYCVALPVYNCTDVIHISLNNIKTFTLILKLGTWLKLQEMHSMLWKYGDIQGYAFNFEYGFLADCQNRAWT